MGKRQRTKIFNSQFQNLRWQLLGSYLLIMTAVFSISNIFIYQKFARNLYQQLDQRLLNLAQAAAHSLNILKQNPQLLNQKKYRFDEDGDLDIPWQNLRQSSQSIEWFDANKQKLTQAGTLISNLPIKDGFQTFQEGQKFRSLTIIAYSYPQGKETIEGFIRASESCEKIEDILRQLRWNCYLGGLTGIGLISIGGMWLTNLAIKPVERSFEQLKQFTADVSHELRSPLTVIKTSVEVIQTHPERVHPADADKLKGIVSATNQMSRLVEDLLWLARHDSTLEMPLKKAMTIPLEELLEDVIEFVEMKAEAKDITLNFEVKNSVLVTGDSSQLLRLFSNLVENAIKYTPNSGFVSVSLQEVDKFALISIQDTGIGIASEHLPFIFNRFWREDKARSYDKGTGLGLAIAQTIAKCHGGDITVTSQLGEGSCFNVRLPKQSKNIL